ncbi:MAG: GrpB family protein [Alphaproteobacteria bacterium]|nr:GrpB family protein [Alphaproteobacteria bacterium]
MFEKKTARIKQTLGNACVAVHHVSSTVVSRLCAKPTLIIAVVKEWSLSVSSLEKIGYEYSGGFNIPFHRLFSKRPPFHNINLHIYEEGNPEVELNLLFRDYLHAYPKTLEEYANLKSELVKQAFEPKTNNEKVS